MRYYSVEAKCGHVGKNRCIYICFAVEAQSRADAASLTRNFGRVKHHHKDAIRQVKEISYAEYNELLAKNNADPYLKCKNVQEQRKLGELNERIVADDYALSRYKKCGKKRDVLYELKKQAIIIKEASKRIYELYDDYYTLESCG